MDILGLVAILFIVCAILIMIYGQMTKSSRKNARTMGMAFGAVTALVVAILLCLATMLIIHTYTGTVDADTGNYLAGVAILFSLLNVLVLAAEGGILGGGCCAGKYRVVAWIAYIVCIWRAYVATQGTTVTAVVIDGYSAALLNFLAVILLCKDNIDEGARAVALDGQQLTGGV